MELLSDQNFDSYWAFGIVIISFAMVLSSAYWLDNKPKKVEKIVYLILSKIKAFDKVDSYVRIRK